MRFTEAVTALAKRTPRPDLVQTNLLLHLDARDLALSDGDAVASWASRVGGWAAVQATSDYQGTYVARSALNGRPAVRMDAGAFMAIAGIERPAATGFSAYYVADIREVNIGHGSTVLQGGQTALYTSVGNERMPTAYLNGGVLLGYDGDTTTGPVCQTWVTGTSPRSWRGRIRLRTGPTTAQTGLVGPVYLGAPDGTGPRADVACLLVYEGIHDDATRQRVWDYIHARWGQVPRRRRHTDGPIAYDGILLSGQSNGAGNALLADLAAPYGEAFPGVRMFNSSAPNYRSREWEDLAPVYSADGYGYGCEVSLMRALAADSAWPNPAIYKCARGSTSLAVDWGPSGRMRNELEDVYQRAVDALPNEGDTLNVRAMVWIQGESDANVEAHANAYEANLTAWIAWVRALVGKPQLKVWLVGLTPTLGAPYVGTVNAAMVAVAAADAFVYLVPPPSPLQPDDTHFTAGGLIFVGEQTLAPSIIAEAA